MLIARLSAILFAPFVAFGGAETVESQEERRSRQVVRAVVGDWKTGLDGSDPTIVIDGESTAAGVTDGPFSLGVLPEHPRFTEGTYQARFKLVRGASDQTAGLVFDLKENGEYLFVRYNTREGNVAIWRFADGERQRVVGGGQKTQLPLGVWHELVVTIAGRRVTGLVNGTLRVEHELPAPVDGGLGLWTKRDSVTEFKNVRVQPASR
jgi:hypothetical protein